LRGAANHLEYEIVCLSSLKQCANLSNNRKMPLLQYLPVSGFLVFIIGTIVAKGNGNRQGDERNLRALSEKISTLKEKIL